MVAKDSLRESSSEYAQGGIAVALSDDDEVELHEQDTLAAGDGLCDQAAVHTLVEEGPGGHPATHRVGRRVRPRGHAPGLRPRGRAQPQPHPARAGRLDGTRNLADALSQGRLAQERPVPQFHRHHGPAGGRRRGRRRGGLRLQHAPPGAAFARARCCWRPAGWGVCTWKPPTRTWPPATAWRPLTAPGPRSATSSSSSSIPPPCTSRARPASCCRRRCAAKAATCGTRRASDSWSATTRWRNWPRGTWSRSPSSPRWRGRAARTCFWTSRTLPPEFVSSRFPRIHQTCLKYGVDLAKDPAPVHPAAHYAMGGVRTDLEGRTSLPRLFAAGEVASTGVHGANRLASNSLLEALVFGARAGARMRDWAGAPILTCSSLPRPEFPDIPEERIAAAGVGEVRDRARWGRAGGRPRHFAGDPDAGLPSIQTAACSSCAGCGSWPT